MNQRQPIKSTRNQRRCETLASLPPVLFSLPNLCESPRANPTTPTPEPIAKVATRLPLVTPPAVTIDARRDEHQKEKSASLLNAAIGFLALTLMLIGTKLYSDRASETSRGLKPTSHSNDAEASIAPVTQNESPTHANPNRGTIANAGPQRANYQAPLGPQSNRSVSESENANIHADASDKPILEISEPVSYQTEEPQSQIQQARFQSSPLPASPLPASPLPASNVLQLSLPVASLPAEVLPAQPAPGQPASPAAFSASVPSAIPAASLNTRDMIRLRQGKPVEMTNRDPNSSSAVQFSGETYPPVRQKYEPLNVPQPATFPSNSYNANTNYGNALPSRPTSMEITTPTKPYQPIGTPPSE